MSVLLIQIAVYLSTRQHVHIVFFFQAEDGIRDLVRSRGLGDVYKRQHRDHVLALAGDPEVDRHAWSDPRDLLLLGLEQFPVSYTHLTLPTSDLV